MKCPNPSCGTVESRVKKTLIQMEQMGGPPGFDFGDLKMRIRECLTCGRQFETFECHRSVFARIVKAKPMGEAKARREPSTPTRRPLKTQLPLDLRRSLDDD